MKRKSLILNGVSLTGLCLGVCLTAAAQEAGTAEATTTAAAAEDDAILRAETIVVLGEITYRNRTSETAPVLEYDQDYFQRFEPLTAGDAMKRVPSVTFLSDVIESDGARMRGLDPGYTQILINGEKVPGAGVDRSFFLDRIPAELIDRVEIVRSSSARRSGDAVAGALNIVLRNGYELDGGYFRFGGLRFDDGETKESVGGVWGGAFAGGRLLVGANLQGRYNPKVKRSLRFGDSPENNPNYAIDDFGNREDQTDTRDGQDYSLNTDYTVELGEDLTFNVSAFGVRTDRVEDERSFEFNDPAAVSGPVRTTPPGNLLTDNANVAKINQLNYSLRASVVRDTNDRKTKLKAGFAGFEDKRLETEDEIDFDRTAPRYTGDLTQNRIEDSEAFGELSHEFGLTDAVDLELGIFYLSKTRDTDAREVRNRFNLATSVRTAWNTSVNNPDDLRRVWASALPVPGGLSSIDETRTDVFAVFSGEAGRAGWETGLRYESTETTIRDQTVPAGSPGTLENAFGLWLPSAHVKFDMTKDDRIVLSAAQTVRRPNFNFVSPVTLLGELGDNDLRGNPNLKPETAWGLDAGYERRLGLRGVAGVNIFYRDVTDLIEVQSTGVTGSAGAGTLVLQPLNAGDGAVYGIELDLSTPLGFAGLPDTGLFANFSWLDSEVNDLFGSRRFNDQSEYVYNFGIIHDFSDLGAAFGATYRKQGDALGRIVGEEIETSYGADLEVFAEKRFGKRFTLRAVGSNLLNASKDELFNKFDTITDQSARSFAEYELETESAGPVVQVMARVAF